MVEVHALAPSLYVAYLVEEGRRRPLPGPAARQFTSRYAAFDYLHALGIDEVDFVHQSAYGEMLGVPGDAGDTELRERVRLADVMR